MELKYYPVSPTNLPKDFTALTLSYQLKAFLAILSILFFFLLYFSLVGVFAYLTYLSVIFPMEISGFFSILVKLGAIAGAAMLFVFTLKFIFKLRNHTPNNRIKLDLKKHKDLQEFVYKICEETGAPRPRNIYIDPDVNAYVAYSNVWLSLIFPTKKDLTLGLGLIECVNLSEFKAITAHEFGHFAQRSMKIGSYILSANTIIHDMIFTRDRWDELLAQWRQTDLRLSAAAWLITPIIWMIRQLLNLFYQFLNIMYSSLSREMEFNADKVAVSVTGSEAIVSGLWKLDYGVMAWQNTLNHAYLASQKNNFVTNLYSNNQLALQRTNNEKIQRLNGLPNDKRGGKQFFNTSENSKVNMYASHPPNDHRENSAKIPFVEGVIDERSPWILFSDKEALQAQMTNLIYEQYFGKKSIPNMDTAAFEQFIETETAGKDLLEEYHHTFANRFFETPELETLQQLATTKSPTQERLNQLKSTLKELMQPVENLNTLLTTVQQVAQGKSKLKSIDYKRKTYGKKDLETLYNKVVKDREKLLENNFKEWDDNFCAFHYALASKVGQQDWLYKLYFQHNTLATFYKGLMGVRNYFISKIHELQNRDVAQYEVENLSNEVKSNIRYLNTELLKLLDLDFVPLPNIDSTDELITAIIDGGKINTESGNVFENGGFDRFMHSLDIAISHMNRIDQHSIATILLMHQELQKRL